MILTEQQSSYDEPTRPSGDLFIGRVARGCRCNRTITGAIHCRCCRVRAKHCGHYSTAETASAEQAQGVSDK